MGKLVDETGAQIFQPDDNTMVRPLYLENNILFRDDRIEVFMNSAGEVFVKEFRYGTCIRIGRYSGGLKVTAHSGILQPTSVNGLPAFSVTER